MIRTTSSIIRSLAAAAALASTGSAFGQLDALLTEPPEGALAVTPPGHARNIDLVGVNRDVLDALQPGDSFDLSLYGNDVVAVVDAVRWQASGRTIRGRFDLITDSHFVITTYEDAVAGAFLCPEWKSMVRLRYGGPGGMHYLHAVETNPADDCLGTIPGNGGVGQRDGHEPAGEWTDSGSPLSGGCATLAPVFDVMLVYSGAARIAAGGTSAIRAECINAVAWMEVTYIASSIAASANIVSLAEVAYDESGRTYNNHLDSLIDPNDGILDGIHATRNAVAADFVSLIVADTGGAGLGVCESSESDAMSVCRWDRIVETFTLAHEVGHNLGCAHDPVNAETCEPYDQGHGHFFFVSEEGVWRHTVMSYSHNDSTRIPYYSSPVVFYRGVATGYAGSRDNRDVIHLRDRTCEAFRRTRMDVWVDFSHSGTENGSHSQPYNTVIEGVNRILPNPVADIPVLHIKPGSRAETITISKPMIINACGGTVTIG